MRDLSQLVFSFAAPIIVISWLLLLLGRCFLRERPAFRSFNFQLSTNNQLTAAVVVAIGVVFLPVSGLPLARWIAGFTLNWSIPLLALVVSETIRLGTGFEMLRRPERRLAIAFGAVGGLLLYPVAMGVGSFDPYTLGWKFGPLFVVMGLLSAALIYLRNRFGWVLVASIVAWHLQTPVSLNYWDCLLDPIYFLFSLGTLVCGALRRKGQKPATTGETTFSAESKP